MEINGTFIYILFAIAYVIFQIFSGKKKKQAPAPKARPNKQQAPNSKQEEITSFEDLFKTITQANTPTKKSNPVQPTTAIKSKLELEKAKDKLKKDTYKVRTKIPQHDTVLELVDLEGEDDDSAPTTERSFNVGNIDWQTAIITKEILDRKYV